MKEKCDTNYKHKVLLVSEKQLETGKIKSELIKHLRQILIAYHTKKQKTNPYHTRKRKHREPTQIQPPCFSCRFFIMH